MLRSANRFKPLSYEQLTPEQKTLVDHLLAGDLHSMDGPGNILQRSPEMGDLLPQVGAYVHQRLAVPKELNQFAILMTAHFRNSQFVW